MYIQAYIYIFRFVLFQFLEQNNLIGGEKAYQPLIKLYSFKSKYDLHLHKHNTKHKTHLQTQHEILVSVWRFFVDNFLYEAMKRYEAIDAAVKADFL